MEQQDSSQLNFCARVANILVEIENTADLAQFLTMILTMVLQLTMIFLMQISR